MHTRLSALVPTLLCTIVLFPSMTTAEAAELDPLLAELEATYHVKVHYQYDPDAFFPTAWLVPSMDPVAKPIHRKDAEALIPTIKQFLSTHPAEVVQGNLEHIYLLGRLSFQGREYGGTHANKSIYVVWDRARKYTLPFLLERLHSEFSSILLDQHDFPTQRWLQFNPEGFQYTGTGFEMLGDDDIYTATEKARMDGFLFKYSTSSIENDFNMISAWLFTKPDELDSVAGQSIRIQQKILCAEDFYRSLSAQYEFR